MYIAYRLPKCNWRSALYSVILENFNIYVIYANTEKLHQSSVKLGDKERFDKEQIGVKEPFGHAKTVP